MNEKNGLVCFLDILGWKGIKQRESEPLKKFGDLISFIKKTINERHIYYSSIFPEIRGSEEPLLINISDTLLIATFYESKYSFIILGDILRKVFVQSLVFSKLFLRGAVSYGSFEFDRNNNFFVGKAIDDVSYWYELSNWIGITMSPSAFFEYTLLKEKDSKLLNYNSWIMTAVDFKTLGKKKIYALNWLPDWKKNGFNKSDLLQSLNIGILSPDIYPKYDNTINFYDANIGNINIKSSFPQEILPKIIVSLKLKHIYSNNIIDIFFETPLNECESDFYAEMGMGAQYQWEYTYEYNSDYYGDLNVDVDFYEYPEKTLSSYNIKIDRDDFDVLEKSFDVDFYGAPEEEDMDFYGTPEIE